jgi:hypothetical protein
MNIIPILAISIPIIFAIVIWLEFKRVPSDKQRIMEKVNSHGWEFFSATWEQLPGQSNTLFRSSLIGPGFYSVCYRNSDGDIVSRVCETSPSLGVYWSDRDADTVMLKKSPYHCHKCRSKLRPNWKVCPICATPTQITEEG